MACVPVTRPAPERQTSSWVTTLGTPAHDYSANDSLHPEPRLVWRVDAGRASRGAPAIAEGVIVVGTVDRMVLVIERQTGEVLWRKRLASGIGGGPLLDDDRIYVATELEDGRVYALRLRDGRQLWSHRPRFVTAPPALSGDALFVGTERGLVLCYDADRGDVRWRRTLGAPVRAAPVATENAVIVAAGESLYVLNRHDGTSQRTLVTEGAVLAAPALVGSALYLGTSAGHITRLRLPSLEIAWNVDVREPVAGSVAVAHDTVYALTRSGTLWTIPVDAPGGARNVKLGIAALAGPTPLARGVLVGSVSGEILLVDPATGNPVWHTRVDGPIEQPPLVSDRMLVVMTGRGDLQAYR